MHYLSLFWSKSRAALLGLALGLAAVFAFLWRGAGAARDEARADARRERVARESADRALEAHAAREARKREAEAVLARERKREAERRDKREAALAKAEAEGGVKGLWRAVFDARR